jgi:hypothetical protein
MLLCLFPIIPEQFLAGAVMCSTLYSIYFLHFHGKTNKYKSFRNIAKNKLSSEFDQSSVKNMFLGIAALSQLVLSFILLKIAG